MRTFRSVGTLVAVVFAISPINTQAAITGLTRVASGLSSPIFATHAPGDRDRLFIVERGSPGDSITANARIKILDFNTGAVLATPFLTIPGIDNHGEGGLLGMAFHPDYATNGKFYVHVTVDPDGSQEPEDENPPMVSHIRQYTVSSNPNIANTSFTTLLSVSQPQNNHNGGWLGFSPIDDYLYIAFGDGGGGNDDDSGHTPGLGNAQDTEGNLLGKMLRIDVDDPDPGSGPNYAIPPTNPFVGAAGLDEIWSYGLRNPFRASFDRITGDLWIGDVGQGAREEVDFQPAGSDGGENYGWRLMEGSIETPTSGIGGPCPGCIAPAYDYGRPGTDPQDPTNQFLGTTVIGGYAYRGPDPSLQGQYLFLDRNAGSGGVNYWMFDPDDPYGTVENIDSIMIPNVGSAGGPVSMGEDAVGNLYITYFSGEVYRIATDELLLGDYNADGDVNDADIDRWRELFGRTGSNLAADGNGDGAVDAADHVLVRKLFGASVHSGAGGSNAAPEPVFAVIIGQTVALSLFAHRRRSRQLR